MELARELYPDFTSEVKADDGIAEAILIADWWIRYGHKEIE